MDAALNQVSPIIMIRAYKHGASRKPTPRPDALHLRAACETQACSVARVFLERPRIDDRKEGKTVLPLVVGVSLGVINS